MGSSQSTRSPTILPSDVVALIASFLLGVEVIQYGRASPSLLAALNAPQVWVGRVEPLLLTHEDPSQLQAPTRLPVSWCQNKAVYLQQRALLFNETSAGHSWRGRVVFLSRATKPRHACGDFVPLDDSLMTGSEHGRFSFEFTFSVPPTRAGASTCHGGILVGFQTTHCSAPRLVTPDGFFSFVSVDSNGGIHLADEQATPKTCVAAKVVFGQWHHLVLTFDGRYLRAYLDGELRYFKRMPRGFPWAALPHGQIGTGFGYDPNRTLATYDDQRVAWRPFHGLVAQARVWGMATDEDNARRLARGDSVTMQPLFAIHQGPDATPRRVITSRPCERYAQILRT